MSTQQIDNLERLLGRVKQRAGGGHVRLDLSAFLGATPAAAPVSAVAKDAKVDSIDDGADADIYDALTSPGREAPSSTSLLEVSTEGLSPESANLVAPVVQEKPEPKAPAEEPAEEAAPRHEVGGAAARVQEQPQPIVAPVSSDAMEITDADEISIIEDDDPEVVAAREAIAEAREEAAAQDSVATAPTERAQDLATAVSPVDMFDAPAVKPKPVEVAAAPVVPRDTLAAEVDKAAPPPLPNTTAPTKASLDVPPAPAAAEALTAKGRLVIGPEVVERASIPTVQVAEMIGATASAGSRNFGDVLSGSLKLRFKPPKTS